ncbi:MAG: trimethylamine methyltransferase family protein, partial [Limibaculum sp.]
MTRERSQGGRRRRSARPSRVIGGISQRPFKQVRLPYRPIEVLGADAIEAIHGAGLTILEEIGIRVLEPRARSLFAGAGAEVDEGEMQVRLDRALVADLVAKAPESFTLAARNPARDVRLGDG